MIKIGKRQIIALATSALLAGTSFQAVFALEDEIVNQNNKITILHTNDMHGRFKRDDKIIGLDVVTAIKNQTPNSILVDAGDTTHGLPFVTLSKGQDAVDLLNATGYEFMAPGNHDFNYGYERLLEIFENAKVIHGGTKLKPLAGNIKKDGESLFEPSAIKEMTVNGKTVKLGLFGMATEETTYKTNPENVKGLDFENPIDTAKREVEKLENQGADVIIALGHIGVDESSSPTSEDIIKAVDGIDVFVDGHSHTAFENGKKVNDTMLVSTGEYLSNLGKVDIELDKDNKVVNVDASLIKRSETNNITPDSTVKKMMDDMATEQEKVLSEVVGNTEVDLDGARESVRFGETNLGNLITDAMINETGADIALTNGGGIRASISKGDITKGDVVSVLPFGNYIVTKNITGAQLKEILEFGVENFGNSFGGFPHVGGMKFVVDPKQPIGERIVSITIGDKKVDMNKIYTLATNDFTAVGGDGYPVLKEVPTLNEYKALNEALEDYIAKLGTVNYKIEGRITTGNKADFEENTPSIPETPKPEAPKVDFKDIDKHWAKDAILNFVKEGHIVGYGDDTFRPNDKMTRAEFIKVVNSVFGFTKEADVNFKDVNEKNWFYKEVKKAVGAGYIKGYEDFTFRPNNEISREEAATIIASITKLSGDKKLSFKDSNDIASWAKDSVDALSDNNIIAGYEDNTFRPKGKMTRSEAVSTLSRVKK